MLRINFIRPKVYVFFFIFFKKKKELYEKYKDGLKLVSKREFNAAEAIFEILLKHQLLQTVRDKLRNFKLFYETYS